MNSPENSNIGQKNPAELVRQAKAGKSEAFGLIYNLYFEKIYRFIFYRVSHKETAEDLAEEVFVKAFEKIHSCKEPDRLEAWIYQITRNRIIDYYRSAKTTVNLEDISELPDLEDSHLEAFKKTEDNLQLLKLLRLLSKEEQRLLQLKFFEGLENSVIAELLGKSEGAVRVAQHRALENLKKLSQQR